MIDWRYEIENEEMEQVLATQTSILAGDHYCQSICDHPHKHQGIAISKITMIIKKNQATGWINPCELATIRNTIAHQIFEKKFNPELLCEHQQENLSRFNEIIQNTIQDDISLKKYKTFWDAAQAIIEPAFCLKPVCDLISTQLPGKELEEFNSVSIQTNVAALEIHTILQKWSVQESEKAGFPPQLLLCLTKEEALEYLEHNAIPHEILLEERQKAAAILVVSHESELITHPELAVLEKQLATRNLTKLTGECAYTGKTTGKVVIILSPHEKKAFNTGDILVTPMTTPEFLPLIKKSAALITDAGGRLCHAAGISRELKKTCVIGTQNATKVLQDGDLIEIDAQKGKITKLEKK